MNFVYQGSRSARWYIENFAGGFAPDADKRSVTVTKRNEQVQGTKRRMLVFNKYPTVTNITKNLDSDEAVGISK